MTKSKTTKARRLIIIALVLSMLLSLAAPMASVFAAEQVQPTNESVTSDLPTIDNTPKPVQQEPQVVEQPTQQSSNGSYSPSLSDDIASTAENVFGATKIELDMNQANQSLGGLKAGLGKILSLALSFLMIWIVATFFADILCRFIAPLKPFLTTKVPLASAHVEMLNGTGLKPWIDYAKERLIELVMAFTLLILVISNTHVTIGIWAANFIISMLGKIATFLMGLF